MLKTRILLVVISAIVVVLLFMLPKVVVENDGELAPADSSGPASADVAADFHANVPPELAKRIADMRTRRQTAQVKEKSAIFADSLANWYEMAGKPDSAAWFAEEAATFFNTQARWLKAGDLYYQAYTLAIDQDRQGRFAEKAQTIYGRILEEDPANLGVKTKLAMTWIGSSNPMQGITLLREVLAQDPENEEALFNMGMLSIQSGQYERAVERLEALTRVNPGHVQGHLLLGVALMNTGHKERARAAFEKVKQLDKDPAVQATVDSYLKDLK